MWRQVTWHMVAVALRRALGPVLVALTAALVTAGLLSDELAQCIDLAARLLAARLSGSSSIPEAGFQGLDLGSLE